MADADTAGDVHGLVRHTDRDTGRAWRRLAVAGLLAVLSVTAGALAAEFDTFPGDAWTAEAVRALGDGYAPVAHVFNEWDWYLAAASLGALLVLAVRGRRIDVAMAVPLLLVARWLLHLARAEVGRPRPSGVPVRDLVDGSSFPSGHVIGAVLFLGVWVWVAGVLLPPRAARLARVLAGTAVLLTAVSRVWAGVHWPSDVAGGVLWGTTALVLIAWMVAPLAPGKRGHAS